MKNLLKIMHVVGARPNFMKTAPIMKAMARYPREFRQVLVHTGQHYDEEMSDIFFRHLGMPRPDENLGVGSGSHAEQTARVMTAFEPVVLKHRPDWVMVVGDVNSTMACALVCVKLGIKAAHVEAGLRSFDPTMPEEWNRLVTDRVADLLLTPSRDANVNLRREGVPASKIRLVGNVMIDTLVQLLPLARKRVKFAPGVPFVLVTLHRPCNVDDPDKLGKIVRALEKIAEDRLVIFPVHPRTRKMMEGLKSNKGSRAKAQRHESLAGLAYLREARGLVLLPPLGYLDFLGLEADAALVITDSGGVQEETTYLGIPCLTVRPNTERPVTITSGTNGLVKAEYREIIAAAEDRLAGKRSLRRKVPPLWDGHAAERIVEVLSRVR